MDRSAFSLRLLLTLTTATFAACGGSGDSLDPPAAGESSGGGDGAGTGGKTKVLSLKVTPPAAVAPGQKATLRWEATEGASVLVEYTHRGSQVMKSFGAKGAHEVVVDFQPIQVKLTATLKGEGEGEDQEKVEQVTLETTAKDATAAQYADKAGAVKVKSGDFITGVSQVGSWTPSGYWKVTVPDGARLELRWPERETCLQNWSVRLYLVDGPRVGPDSAYAGMLSSGECDWGGGNDMVYPLLRNLKAGTYTFAPALSEENQRYTLELRVVTKASCGDGVVDYAAGEQCEPKGTTNCDDSCKTQVKVQVPAQETNLSFDPEYFDLAGGETRAIPLRPAADRKLTKLGYRVVNPAELWLAIINPEGGVVWETLKPSGTDDFTPNITIPAGETYQLIVHRSTMGGASSILFRSDWE